MSKFLQILSTKIGQKILRVIFARMLVAKFQSLAEFFRCYVSASEKRSKNNFWTIFKIFAKIKFFENTKLLKKGDFCEHAGCHISKFGVVSGYYLDTFSKIQQTAFKNFQVNLRKMKKEIKNAAYKNN